MSWWWLALAATPWSAQTPLARTHRLEALAPAPLAQRVLQVSEGFLGVPYLVSPLGEGEGLDADPLVRLDAVDCQTFVEQTMAMALGPADNFVPTLNAIRYRGEPRWEHRRHVVEAQWVPDNIAEGRLVDVTARLGGPRTRRVEKVLAAKTWAEKSGVSLQLAPEFQPQGSFALDIVPAALALEVLAKAPPGLVVVVVRADRPSVVTRVSHMGLLVQSKKGPMLRHASRSFKRVVDEPLSRYLGRNLAHGLWTVEGLALFEIQAPGR
jgi:hypothetical protein